MAVRVSNSAVVWFGAKHGVYLKGEHLLIGKHHPEISIDAGTCVCPKYKICSDGSPECITGYTGSG